MTNSSVVQTSGLPRFGRQGAPCWPPYWRWSTFRRSAAAQHAAICGAALGTRRGDAGGKAAQRGWISNTHGLELHARSSACSSRLMGGSSAQPFCAGRLPVAKFSPISVPVADLPHRGACWAAGRSTAGPTYLGAAGLVFITVLGLFVLRGSEIVAAGSEPPRPLPLVGAAT